MFALRQDDEKPVAQSELNRGEATLKDLADLDYTYAREWFDRIKVIRECEQALQNVKNHLNRKAYEERVLTINYLAESGIPSSKSLATKELEFQKSAIQVLLDIEAGSSGDADFLMDTVDANTEASRFLALDDLTNPATQSKLNWGLEAASIRSLFKTYASGGNRISRTLSLFDPNPTEYFGTEPSDLGTRGRESTFDAQIRREIADYDAEWPNQIYEFLSIDVGSPSTPIGSRKTIAYRVSVNHLNSQTRSKRVGQHHVQAEVTKLHGKWKITALRTLRSGTALGTVKMEGSTQNQERPPSTIRREDLPQLPEDPVRQQVEQLLTNYFDATNPDGDLSDFADLFAPRVLHFGEHKSLRQVLEEEIAYHEEHPGRSLTLNRILRMSGAGNTHTVDFEFKLQPSPNEVSQRRKVRMKIRRERGEWKITEYGSLGN